MKRLLAFILLASLPFYALAQESKKKNSEQDDGLFRQEKIDIVNRFKDGPKMIAKDIEYISARNVTTFKIYYNLFIHSPLVENMADAEDSDKHKKAKEHIVKQSKQLCNRYEEADACTIYLWSDLSLIPISGAGDASPEELAYAHGIFIKEQGQPPKFQWHDEATRKELIARKKAQRERKKKSEQNKKEAKEKAKKEATGIKDAIIKDIQTDNKNEDIKLEEPPHE